MLRLPLLYALLHLTVLDHNAGASGDPVGKTGVISVIIAVDASKTNASQRKKQEKFITGLSTKIFTANDKDRIGIIEFGSNSTLLLGLRGGISLTQVQAAVKLYKGMGDGTMYSAALNFTKDHLNQTVKGSRSSIVVLVTHNSENCTVLKNQSTLAQPPCVSSSCNLNTIACKESHGEGWRKDCGFVLNEANDLKIKYGVKIISVGVGNSINKDRLKCWASDNPISESLDAKALVATTWAKLTSQGVTDTSKMVKEMAGSLREPRHVQPKTTTALAVAIGILAVLVIGTIVAIVVLAVLLFRTVRERDIYQYLYEYGVQEFDDQRGSLDTTAMGTSIVGYTGNTTMTEVGDRTMMATDRTFADGFTRRTGPGRGRTFTNKVKRLARDRHYANPRTLMDMGDTAGITEMATRRPSQERRGSRQRGRDHGRERAQDGWTAANDDKPRKGRRGRQTDRYNDGWT